MNKCKGFTLIEIAIVITIIGILLGAILLRSGSVIGNAKTTDTIALIKDLNAAINDFKNRYHYLPGDLPNAGNDIPGIAGQLFAGQSCDILTTTANIGDGNIDPGIETTCASIELVLAGLIKGDSNGIFTRSAMSATPDVLITLRRSTGLNQLPATVLNEIQLLKQPCEAAQGIDSKLDDGNFKTGKITASVDTCTPGNSATDPVPFIDIAL